jgi:hypothetical protein
MRQLCTTGLLVNVLLLGSPAGLAAQKAVPPMSTWQAPPLPDRMGKPGWALNEADLIPLQDTTVTRSHTGTGLLVGGLIGVAATTVFLIGYCDDPDTRCEIDEVGRALLIIAVPAAALGALIGSLIRS